MYRHSPRSAPSAIPARVCNISLVALQGANPDVEPKKASLLAAGIVPFPARKQNVSKPIGRAWNVRVNYTF